MKAYRIAAYTGPSGLELVNEPEPPAPQGRQVLVRVRASSINFRELMDVRGDLARMSPLAERRIPGSDAAGEVVAIGPAVTRVRPGDRVATIFYADWLAGDMPARMNILGRSAGPNDGTLTEFTCVDESELVHLPSHLSFEEAATLPCAAVTAWASLFGDGRLLPGMVVLLQGTGGVSTFALQFARLAGARVIATTTSPSKARLLKEQGAEVVVDASNGAAWNAEVQAATAGAGVDLAINVAGGDTLEPTVKAIRPGGRMVLVGARDAALSPLSARFMMRGLGISVSRVGSREHFEQMNRAIEGARLKPVIARVFPFDQAREAFDYFATARHVGKIVIQH